MNRSILLVVILLALSTCAIAAASATDNVARVNESQALIEMARAMQISNAGNAASIFWLGAIAVILLVAVVLLLALLLRRGAGQGGKRRDGSGESAQLPARMDPMTAMLMTVMMQTLKQNTARPGLPEPTAFAAPVQQAQDEEIDAPWWQG